MLFAQAVIGELPQVDYRAGGVWQLHRLDSGTTSQRAGDVSPHRNRPQITGSPGQRVNSIPRYFSRLARISSPAPGPVQCAETSLEASLRSCHATLLAGFGESARV